MNAVRNHIFRHVAAKQYSTPRFTLIFRLNNEFVKTSNGSDTILGIVRINGEKRLGRVALR